jgi:lipopolysaccharide transport system permease protein
VQTRSDIVSEGRIGPFASVWRRRDLLARLVEREVEGRFRGSLLGKIWAVIVPLVMLALYTFVFGAIIRPRWQDSAQSGAEVALTYFAGLILFEFLFECIIRAPTLLLEHGNYIKKFVFPIEILAWVIMFGAFFRLAISFAILLVFYLFFAGIPPVSALLIPIFILPLGLFAVGFVWFLSALGVYVRDIKQIIGVAAPLVMFLSPVFFPLSAVPERFQKFFYINPLTVALEGVRSALFVGHWRPSVGFLLYVFASWLFAWLGYRVFARLRPGFADVL